MIDPPPSAAIRVPISAESRNAPLRFTAITLSNSSSVTSASEGYSGEEPGVVDQHVDPAELAVDLRRPARRTGPSRPTWQATAERLLARGLRDLLGGRVQASCLRLATTTVAPCRA